MSVGSLLLRVLLSIGLVLNGSSDVLASAHMAMGHGEAPGSPASTQKQHAATAAATPCPDHARDGAMASNHRSPDSTPAEPPSRSEQPTPDCCQSDACRCACMHNAAVAMPTLAFPGWTPGHALDARPLKPAHATPALPHLIRPPIG